MPPDGSCQALGLRLGAHFDLISTSSSYDSWHPCPISENWRHEKEKYWLILPTHSQGASLSTFLGWLNHWVITQRHPHKCATIRLDLSRISQHFLHLWNFHFQMSQALIQVFFHFETSLIVKLAQKITWSEHFPPRCVFSNLSNFDWRVFMHCY